MNSRNGMNNKSLSKIGFKHFSNTIMSTVLGFIVIGICWLTKTDLSQYISKVITTIGQVKLNNIVIFFLLIIVGVLIDIHRNQIHNKQLLILKNNSYETFKATMESINDMVSNFIHSVQLYRLDTEGTTDPEKEKELDEMIASIIKKLRDHNLVDNIIIDQLGPEVYLLRTKNAPLNLEKLKLLV